MVKPPREDLEKHYAYYSPDSDFSAYARLLQSKWRQKHGYPKGKLGNYLELDFAKSNKTNYLTDKIKNLVQYEVYAQKNEGKFISEPRIWDNLLSSQPLCFNLFGELHFDLKLATKYFSRLFPTRVKQVTAVKFEYSPGRGHINYTGDHSAFDVFIEYNSHDGKRGFIGIEVKYAEDLKDVKKTTEATFLKHRDDYLRIASESKLFKPNSTEVLRYAPLQQIWRDHLLSITTLKDYGEGCFVFLFPSQNKECQNAVAGYQQQLNDGKEEITGFLPRFLEDFINTLHALHPKEWASELKERYLGESYKA